MSKLNIGHEPLSWELLDFWKASGLPPCAVRAAPIVVARRNEKIVGFAALGREPENGYAAVIEPLIASSFHVGVKIMDEMEKLLWSVGIKRYAFYTNEYTHKNWRNAVATSEVVTKLGEDESGAIWYSRIIGQR